MGRPLVLAHAVLRAMDQAPRLARVSSVWRRWNCGKRGGRPKAGATAEPAWPGCGWRPPGGMARSASGGASKLVTIGVRESNAHLQRRCHFGFGQKLECGQILGGLLDGRLVLHARFLHLR